MAVEFRSWKCRLATGGSLIVKSFVHLRSDPVAMQLLGVDYFTWKVNNGVTVYLWEDVWHEGGPLMTQFRRLYRIQS